MTNACGGPPAPRLIIISGGQTGVDQGALAAALSNGIPIQGWCPKGRQAENGEIPKEFPLQETGTSDPAERTRKNVEMADATLILHKGRFSGGTALARQHARRQGKRVLSVDLAHPRPVEAIMDWILSKSIERLNIAGPRESEVPGIQDETRSFCGRLFAILHRRNAG